MPVDQPIPQTFPDVVLNLILEYRTLEEMIAHAYTLPTIVQTPDADAVTQESFRIAQLAQAILERYLKEISAAETHKIRLIREPDDLECRIFERTTNELQREKKLLLRTSNVSKENKALLANSDDPSHSLEALIKLDKLIDNINIFIINIATGPLKNDVEEVEDVEEICLSGLDLTRLPETVIEYFKGFPNLKKLLLKLNYFSTIPESIGKLAVLTELILNNNKLITLPNTIGDLVKLKRLDVSCNKLTMIPDIMDKLAALTELNLSNNKLTTLPNSIGGLVLLTKLVLSFNELSTLPESIGDLRMLTYLSLCTNPLPTLPESIGNLGALKELSLGSNITILPESARKILEKTRNEQYLHYIKLVPQASATGKNLQKRDLILNVESQNDILEALGAELAELSLENDRRVLDNISVPEIPQLEAQAGACSSIQERTLINASESKPIVHMKQQYDRNAAAKHVGATLALGSASPLGLTFSK